MRAEHHQTRVSDIEVALDLESTKNAELQTVLAKEELDVAEVQRITKKFSRVMWNKVRQRAAEELAKEELEAKAAADAVAESDERISTLSAQRERLLREVSELSGAAEEEDTARFELETFVRRNFTEASQELRELDHRTAQLKKQLVEIEEAVIAGEFALEELDDLVSQLRTAKRWSELDIWYGGFLVSIAKHDKVKVSSKKSRDALHALEIFHKELRDTGTEVASLHLDMASKWRFGDVWFDNLFVDLHVDGHVREALDQAVKAVNDVEETLAHLQRSATTADAEIDEIQMLRLDILARPQSSA